MEAKIIALVACLVGCAVETREAPAPGPAWAYSHTVNLEGTVGCVNLRSTSPSVALDCGNGERSDICLDAGNTRVDVYALPGAGEGAPFGVASLVVLEECP